MVFPFDISMLNIFAGIASLVFTLMIFSYVIGDNFLFRIALYIFTGVSAGYIASVAWWQVLRPKFALLLTGSTMEAALLIVPLVGIFMIGMKLSPRLAGIARPAMAFIVGAGAAVTIAGALSGTLLPQVNGTINAFSLTQNQNILFLANGFTILLGTILSLAYFHFGAHTKPDGVVRRLGVIEILAWLGRFFIGVTLGAVFAGVYAAALTALIERVSSMVNFFGNIP